MTPKKTIINNNTKKLKTKTIMEGVPVGMCVRFGFQTLSWRRLKRVKRNSKCTSMCPTDVSKVTAYYYYCCCYSYFYCYYFYYFYCYYFLKYYFYYFYCYYFLNIIFIIFIVIIVIFIVGIVFMFNIVYIAVILLL